MGDDPSPLERAAARNLVRNYLKVRPGENVLVESWSHTVSTASAMVDEVRRIGGHAFLAYEDDDAWWRAIDRKQGKLLGSLSDPEWAAIRAADVYVQSWGPEDSARLETVPVKQVDAWADAWFERWYKIARATGLRGGRMAVGWVTDSRAKKWGVRKREWKDQLLRGCLADPTAMARRGQRLARTLGGKGKVRITHPNGTDVEVALAGIPPRIYDGTPHPRNKVYSEYDMMSNFPDGRLRVALDSKTAEGQIVGNRPSYEQVWFPWPKHTGGRFAFSGGELTDYSFETGEAEFTKRFDKGSAGRDRTSCLSIGLNPAIENVPYVEDRQVGCVDLAVGGNNFLRGSNRSDFYGWVSLAGAEVQVDGIPIVRSGRIL